MERKDADPGSDPEVVAAPEHRSAEPAAPKALTPRELAARDDAAFEAARAAEEAERAEAEEEYQDERERSRQRSISALVGLAVVLVILGVISYGVWTVFSIPYEPLPQFPPPGNEAPIPR